MMMMMLMILISIRFRRGFVRSKQFGAVRFENRVAENMHPHQGTGGGTVLLK